MPMVGWNLLWSPGTWRLSLTFLWLRKERGQARSPTFMLQKAGPFRMPSER